MKTITDFIQRLLKDLHLDGVAPNVQKALELKIGAIVDEQIESALAHSLTEDDWKVYDEYRRNHPEAKVDEAMQAMTAHRPDIEAVMEGALISTYDDLMAREEAVRMVLDEADSAK